MAASISGIGVGLGLSCFSNFSKPLHSSQSSGSRVKITVSVEDKKKNYTLQKSEEAFNAAKNLMMRGVNSSVRAFKFVVGQSIVIDFVKAFTCGISTITNTSTTLALLGPCNNWSYR
ncbi:hypothetical protein V6N13_074655 [Hibiscus sabdariffa]|uniref:Uncharacterized protein n=1 Tax=Hibiscus sabdariffa TaxID=183260 RepID=A0ABR2U9D2_9ROSI